MKTLSSVWFLLLRFLKKLITSSFSRVSGGFLNVAFELVDFKRNLFLVLIKTSDNKLSFSNTPFFKLLLCQDDTEMFQSSHVSQSLFSIQKQI